MTTEHQSRPTGTLLSDAARALSDLVRGEIALARAELEENIRKAVGGLILVVLAVAVALAALDVLAGAAVAALVAQGLSAGWSAFIVAAVLVLAAVVLAALGLRALAPSKLFPRRTARNIRRDAQNLKEILTHDPAS